jgi:hypothetical protein
MRLIAKVRLGASRADRDLTTRTASLAVGVFFDRWSVGHLVCCNASVPSMGMKISTALAANYCRDSGFTGALDPGRRWYAGSTSEK